MEPETLPCLSGAEAAAACLRLNLIDQRIIHRNVRELSANKVMQLRVVLVVLACDRLRREETKYADSRKSIITDNDP